MQQICGQYLVLNMVDFLNLINVFSQKENYIREIKFNFIGLISLKMEIQIMSKLILNGKIMKVNNICGI